jgi:2-polyprenyl-3-methyl-5-hydroxy-6-metoxy-1,4-benzoquinol methylase
MSSPSSHPDNEDKTKVIGLFEPETYRSWKSWTEDAFGDATKVEKHTFCAELRLAGVRFDERLRVLEIGFGNGAFASWVMSQGWMFVGTEIDRELVVRARAKGWDAHYADERLADIASGKQFDLVVAFDVLEHLTLPEIVNLLVSVKSLLAPNGKFLARFPSGDSPFSRAMQYGDLTHRSVIGSGIVTQLALQTGLRVVQIRAPAFPLFGLGIKRFVRRMGVLMVRTLIARMVNFAFHDNRPKVIEQNLVIVLEILHR